MIPESIAAIPGQNERVVSLITKNKKSAPDREFIALSMLECMRLMFYHKESTQRSWVVPCEIDL